MDDKEGETRGKGEKSGTGEEVLGSKLEADKEAATCERGEEVLGSEF